MEENNKTKELKKWTQKELDAVLQKHIDNGCKPSLDLSYSNLDGLSIKFRYLNNVDFSNSYLFNVFIEYCKFFECRFDNSTIFNMNIYYSEFSECAFINASLYHSRYTNCNIGCSNLASIDIQNCKFLGTIIHRSICTDANFYNNYMYNSNLILDLTKANVTNASFYSNMKCPSSGKFIGWKKCDTLINNKRVHCLVKLEIPAKARRSSAFGDKCRASCAKVLAIEPISGYTFNEPITEVSSLYYSDFVYRVGKTVSVDNFDENRWHECAPGIHFFVDKEAALRY